MSDEFNLLATLDDIVLTPEQQEEFNASGSAVLTLSIPITAANGFSPAAVAKEPGMRVIAPTLTYSVDATPGGTGLSFLGYPEQNAAIRTAMNSAFAALNKES
jgi:hypothetical protein